MNEKQASVAARIAELASLPIAELWLIWDRYFSSRPLNPNRAFIESRIAYKLQEEAFGGLAPATRQRPCWRNRRHPCGSHRPHPCCG